MPKSFVHQADPTAKEALTAWWKLFDDPILERLIQKAAAQNYDIRTAGVRILQARAALGIAEGFRYPQKQTLSGAYGVGYDKGHIDAAAFGLDTVWELDLWGRYARQIESAEASLMAAIEGYRAATVAVVAEVADRYLAYRTAQERLAYARRNAAIQERVAKMTEVQFRSGNVSELDMQQARTQLHNTKAAIPALQSAAAAAVNALAVLLGTTPERIESLLRNGTQPPAPPQQNGTLRLPEDPESLLDIDLIPMPRFDPAAVLDARLLLQRPDIRAAEHLAHAAAAEIGAAEALLYPSFTLLGSIGYQATDRNPIFRSLTGWGSLSDNIVISAGPGLSWNILQYGRLKNQVRLKDALLQERLIAYTKALITAAAEVDSALKAYRFNLRQLQERKKALEATVRAFNISALQYHEGMVSYQRLLSTVEKLTYTQDIYAQTKGAAARQLVYLFKALGGGWQIGRGRNPLHPADRAALQKRGVDWEGWLESNRTAMPEGER